MPKTSKKTRARASLLVAARTDQLQAKLAQVDLPDQLRIRRARSPSELIDMLAPADRLPHESDDSSVQVVLLDDDFYAKEEDGSSLITRLLSIRPGLKVIWVTDQLDPAREIKARRLGVYFIISRPLEPTLLSRVIKATVEHETTRVHRMSI